MTPQELHIKNDFFAKLKHMKRNYWGLHLPSNYFIPSNPLRETFYYGINAHGILFASEFKAQEIDLPDYAKEALIVIDVLLKIKRRNLTSALLYVYDENDELIQGKSMTDVFYKDRIFNEDVTMDQCSQIENLLDLMVDKVSNGNDNFEQAESLGIGEGYKVLYKFYEKGGINDD